MSTAQLPLPADPGEAWLADVIRHVARRSPGACALLWDGPGRTLRVVLDPDTGATRTSALAAVRRSDDVKPWPITVSIIGRRFRCLDAMLRCDGYETVWRRA